MLEKPPICEIISMDFTPILINESYHTNNEIRVLFSFIFY